MEGKKTETDQNRIRFNLNNNNILDSGPYHLLYSRLRHDLLINT